MVIFMIWILILICCLLSFVSKFNNKYRSPYVCVHVFGLKGSGKSTLFIKWMLKDLKKGWTVYTDMPGVHVPGTKMIDAKALATFRPVENSAIYLDEAGLTFDNRKYKDFDTGLRDFFALQRKFRVKVILNSQTTDIDLKIRSRLEKMYLIKNFGAFSIIRPIIRDMTLTDPGITGTESRIVDKLKFGSIFSIRILWIPKYVKFFESFNPPFRPELPYHEIKPITEIGEQSGSDDQEKHAKFRQLKTFRIGRKRQDKQ